MTEVGLQRITVQILGQQADVNQCEDTDVMTSILLFNDAPL